MNSKIVNYRDFLSGLSNQEKEKANFIASVVWSKSRVLNRGFINETCHNGIFYENNQSKLLVLVDRDCKSFNLSKMLSNCNVIT